MVVFVRIRINEICTFFVTICREHSVASNRCKETLSTQKPHIQDEGPAKQLMSCRRLQPHWLLDRTGSTVEVFVVYDLKDTLPELM